MDRNAKGPEVVALQNDLTTLGYALPKSTLKDGSLDGIAGGEVLAAVQDFAKSVKAKKPSDYPIPDSLLGRIKEAAEAVRATPLTDTLGLDAWDGTSGGLFINEDGFLAGEGVTIMPATTNRTRAIITPPRGLVWHWTAGTSEEESYAQNLATRITQPEGRNASWHALISRAGHTYSQVPVNRGAHHAKMANPYYLGVETVAAGPLKRVDGEFYAWPYYRLGPDRKADKRLGPDPRCKVDAKRAILLGSSSFRKTWWDRHTNAQVLTAAKMCRALLDHFKTWTPAKLINGHFQFPDTTKEDPGPFWMSVVLPAIAARLEKP